MLNTLLNKLPLSQGGKVFVGTALCLGICAIPLTKSKSACLLDWFVCAFCATCHSQRARHKMSCSSPYWR